MKKIVRLSLTVAFVLSGLLLVSCCGEPPLPMTIERTVLVYMATDNNLAPYSGSDVAELKRGYIPQWFDEGSGDVLLVYRHALNQNPHLIRMYSVGGEVIMDTLISYPSQNSCVDTTFKKVLADAFGQFPSSERGLVLSSHGTGWLPEGYYDHPKDYLSAGTMGAPAAGVVSGARQIVELPVTEDPYAWMVKTFGHENDGTEMEIDVLKNSLNYHLDWMIFDCCLMGGVEVAYQMRSRSDYVVFSQTEIMADGFPYYGLMEIAFRKGSDVTKRVKGMAELYYDYYDSQTDELLRSATISVVKTSELSSLASSVKNILGEGGRANTDTLSLDSQNNLRYVQPYFRYNRHWFYDLDDYISQVCPDVSLYSAFTDAMGKTVIYKAATPSFMKNYGGFDIRHFSGLSTYVPRPKNAFLGEYWSKLEWGAFIGGTTSTR